jgi:hypothetical protein
MQAMGSGVFQEVFKSDPRWRLVERILLMAPFQKSSRLPNLLRYLAEHSIQRHPEQLIEHRIGVAVFGKAPGYSPTEDSAVRVHVRQLRLRLHEYFAREGRHETLTVDIPKGSYELVFQDVDATPALPRRVERSGNGFGPRDALAGAAVLVALVCGTGWYRAVQTSQGATAPWPVSGVVRKGQQTKVVVSDGSLMLRLIRRTKFTLEDYLRPGFLKPGFLDPRFLAGINPPQMQDDVSRLVTYISSAQITAFADTQMASTLMKLAGERSENLVLTTARNLNRQNMEQGNFVFVGGPTSNPWVSLFADKINFETVEDDVGGRIYFRNKRPRRGERTEYVGLRSPGSDGDDYATISLLPSGSGQGTVMILQGLREEGTEALGDLLASARDRAELARALKVQEGRQEPVYFEALIRARTVAGAPVSIKVVATRIISA